LAVLIPAYLLGGVTGDPTVYNAGVWVKHPGVAVGKLLQTDTQMTTVVGDINGYLHAWYPDGTERPGFPKLICNQTHAISNGGIPEAANYSVNSTPTLADINGDGNLEIFVGSGDGWVYGLQHDGTNVPGWPQFTGVCPPNHLYGVFASPTVADVDKDGTQEVIVGAWSHWLYVWNANGSVQWRFDNLDTIWSSAAVADFNDDGYLEIVVGGDWTEPDHPETGGGGVLRMFRYNGTEMPGWPKRINQVIWSSPAIGDIDNDGDADIIVGTGNYYTYRARYVNGYDWQGNTLSGWPVTLPLLPGAPGPDTNSARYGVFASPALADIDNDGKLEVLIGDMFCAFHCIDWDGTIRWSRQVGSDWSSSVQFSSPAVGDIDGDGGFEVVTGGGTRLFAFSALTGDSKAGYPINTALPTGNPNYPMITWSSPTIADVDGDGLVEVLIGNGCKDWPGVANAGGVTVYHESGIAVPAGEKAGPTGVAWSVAPWPRFRRSNTGTGSLSDTVPSFDDVPRQHLFYSYVETIFGAQITAGCGTRQYCPDSPVTRAQMAVFLEKAMRGSNYTPPAPTGVFGDVPTGYWAAAWVERLATDQITAGCGNGNYCPDSPITRGQMAVFLLKAKHGPTYTPPAPTDLFTDVPSGYWARDWIEQLFRENITAGCSETTFCPDQPVTRGQMAVFLAKTFGL